MIGGELDAPVRELRRGYHDRIADLRSRSTAIVADAAAATEEATAAILQWDPEAPIPAALDRADVAARVDEVEAEVLSLLALQSPVARDLRIILSAHDITHTGALCLGLARTLARRAAPACAVLPVAMRDQVGDLGRATSALLRQANGAWTTLDAEQAWAVDGPAETVRTLHRDFLSQLVGLSGVPVDIAVDLGLTGRAYERLTDHAIEIAARVLFATGVPSGLPG